jgi:hypothetical protein
MTSVPPRFTPRACALATALVAGWLPTAFAETGPWYIGARETITHDSNVYRTPDATSDMIFSTGVFGGLDQRISRQRLRANVAADWNRYRDQDRLNHSSGNGYVRLDWETVGNLSGDIQLSHKQDLYRDYLTADQAQNKTIVRSTDGEFTARLGVVTAWTVEAGVFGSRTRFRGSISDTNDIDYDGYRAAVRYNPRSHISVGIGARHAKGKYPRAGSPFDFDRDDIDLLVTWNPSPISNFDGRLSRSKWDYATDTSRSTHLTTGSLMYHYRPGGRLSLDAVASRDDTAGQYNTSSLAIIDNRIEIVSAQTVNTRVSNVYGLSGRYELTGKTALNASVQRIDRTLDDAINTGTTTSTVAASDRAYSATLGATWDPLRSVRVGCGYTHVKRSVSDGSLALTYPYSVNLVNCSAQIALQP